MLSLLSVNDLTNAAMNNDTNPIPLIIAKRANIDSI